MGPEWVWWSPNARWIIFHFPKIEPGYTLLDGKALHVWKCGDQSFCVTHYLLCDLISAVLLKTAVFTFYMR